MYAKHSRQSRHAPEIELLAQESQASFDVVARLYGNELAKLEVGARIQNFLPILAIRKVREILRQRWLGKRPLVLVGRG